MTRSAPGGYPGARGAGDSHADGVPGGNLPAATGTNKFSRLDELAAIYDDFDRAAARQNAASPGSARAVQLYTDRERALSALSDEQARLARTGAATGQEVHEHLSRWWSGK